ncbi:MAG: S8 family serine peptidase [Rubrivivax sp.]|nr:S8 family serine peptidase [Rubrivivax sp.]
MNKKNLMSLTLLAALCAAIGSAQAQDYVLQAASWGAAQQAAVAAAGGSVRYADAEGLALVSAPGKDFLKRVLAGGAVRSGAPDRAVNFTPPVREQELRLDAVPATITDTFYATVQWAPQAVGAPAAWAAGYTGRGVRVAVIDGGIYGAHVDLAANIDTVAARSFATGTPNGCLELWHCDTGTFWHGTHVAGIIAAPANGIGVVGIAPEATIVPVKALHSGSGSFGAVIAAILYASGDGRADIINMSLGAEFNRGDREAAELVSALNRAVNTASRRGTLVISAAGNSSLDLDHSGNLIATPAQSGNGLAISATGPMLFAAGATNFSRIASYTNYGTSAITLAAPGGDFAYPGNENCTVPLGAGTLTRPCWVFDMVLSTSRGGTVAGGYSWAAGTSMAAPAAAAVAALIKQKNPGLSVGALKNELRRATDDQGKNGRDPYYGSGFLDAAKAVAP